MKLYKIGNNRATFTVLYKILDSDHTEEVNISRKELIMYSPGKYIIKDELDNAQLSAFIYGNDKDSFFSDIVSLYTKDVIIFLTFYYNLTNECLQYLRENCSDFLYNEALYLKNNSDNPKIPNGRLQRMLKRLSPEDRLRFEIESGDII